MRITIYVKSVTAGWHCYRIQKTLYLLPPCVFWSKPTYIRCNYNLDKPRIKITGRGNMAGGVSWVISNYWRLDLFLFSETAYKKSFHVLNKEFQRHCFSTVYKLITSILHYLCMYLLNFRTSLMIFITENIIWQIVILLSILFSFVLFFKAGSD